MLLGTDWQDDMRYVFYVSLYLRTRVSVDDMNPSQKGMSCDLPERSRNLYELLKVEMEKVHLELSVTVLKKNKLVS